jgi:hypothetical protein
MLNGREPIIITERTNYAKIIAITAITVAVVEAAFFIGWYIVKKVRNSKIEFHHALDDGFDTLKVVNDVKVKFQK